MDKKPKRAWSDDFQKTLEIIAYGKKRGQFPIEDLRRDTGLNDGQILLYGIRPGGVLEVTANEKGILYYSVKMEAFGVYLNHMSLVQAQRHAQRAYVLAALGVVVGLLAIVVAISLAFR